MPTFDDVLSSSSFFLAARCHSPLGVGLPLPGDGDDGGGGVAVPLLPDSAFTASSSFDAVSVGPHNAR